MRVVVATLIAFLMAAGGACALDLLAVDATARTAGDHHAGTGSASSGDVAHWAACDPLVATSTGLVTADASDGAALRTDVPARVTMTPLRTSLAARTLVPGRVPAFLLHASLLI